MYYLAWTEHKSAASKTSYSKDISKCLFEALKKCLLKKDVIELRCSLSAYGLALYVPCSPPNVVTNVQDVLKQVLTPDDFKSLEWKTCKELLNMEK